MPEVSVVIPCYNHAHYLSACLGSVLDQTYPAWEAIVVDDGSSDNTREVVTQFTDPRMKYVYQNNQGLPSARNTGIREAEGSYLAFLDADDEWEAGFLEVCANTLADRSEVVAVVTLHRFIDESGALLPQVGGLTVKPEQFRSQLLKGGFFPPNAALVRAESVRRAGLFDESLSSVEDWDLWLRITAGGGTMLCIEQPLARYRVYSGSMSTNAARMHANRMAVLTKHYGSPEGDPTTWSADRRRACAFAHRDAGLGYIAQGQSDEGWDHLRQAVKIEPGLLERLDTFYELALGDQPRGYRGEPGHLDIAANGANLLRGVDVLFASADGRTQPLRGVACGNAYLALAMLSDQAGRWALARHYIVRAIREHPALLRQPGVPRRLIKLFSGKRVVNAIRRLTERAGHETLTEKEPS